MTVLSPLIALAAALLFASPAFAEVEAPATAKAPGPVEMVRTLQTLQDQIATGSTEAHIAQRALLGHIDNRLNPLDGQTWAEPKNVRAAVIFVLSGGKPAILKRIAATGGLAKTDELLVKGALAYVEGREEEAGKLLGEVDVHTLPASLAGQVALVQSALIVRNDPAKSVELLDFVRLQLPGTLVEEAALRREIFVVSQMGDLKKFDLLSRQYLRRFRHSVYSGNFRQRFAAALTRLEFAKDEVQFARLVSMLDELESEVSRDLYLMVARAAIDQGQTKAAILAADKARGLSASDKVAAARASLYRAASVIVSPAGFEVGLEELKKIDKADLPERDVALLESALSMAGYIRSAPVTATAPPAPKVPAQQAVTPAPAAAMSPSSVIPLGTPPALPAASLPAPGAQDNMSSPAIARAQDALGRVDQLFKRGVP